MIYIFIRISRLLEPLFSTFRAILGDGAKKQPNRFTAPELIIMNNNLPPNNKNTGRF